MTVGVFWKLVLTKQYTFLDGPDFAYQVAPWLEVQAYAWHHGDFPLLWDPYVAGGQSLIGQAQPASAFPLNWLLFVLPLHRGFLQLNFLHWYMVLVHFFAALAAYALCRDLGRSRAASILGASAYAFGGYVATTWWPQQVQGAIFAPLALLFTLRAIRGERIWASSLFAGFFLGLMWLGGHHQVPIFVALGISGVWLFHIFAANTVRAGIHRAILFAALMSMMVAAGALQLFPSYSYGLDSVRWVGANHPVGMKEAVPYSVHEAASQSADAVLGTFMDGIYRHANPFIGFTVFLLAIIAVPLAWKELAVRLLAFLALGGMLLAMGGSTPLHSILYAVVPLVEKARTPAVAVIVFQLAIAPLAAFGLDRVLEAVRSHWVRRASILSVVVGVLLLLLAVHMEVDHPQPDWHLYSAPVTAIVAILLGALLFALYSGSVEPRRASPWFVVLVMIEIGNLSGMTFKNRDTGWEFWPVLERDRDVARFLKSQPGPFRIEAKTEDVPYSFGDWYGIEALTGYTASLMRPFEELKALPAVHRMLSVRYYLAKTPASGDQREAMTGEAGIRVFENPDFMPRAWAVHRVSAVPAGKIVQMLANLDLAHETILTGDAPALENCDGDRLEVTRHRAESVSIQADMKCRGMAILGDVLSKDWTATVDDRPVRIYAAYGLIRGVVVEAGQHRIEYRYRPRSVYAGALLTFSSFGFALALWLRGRKRRTPNQTA